MNRWRDRFAGSRSRADSARARRSRTTALAAETQLLYADSSALVKLVVDEPESRALARYLTNEPALATSRIALVEVPRAVTIANPSEELEAEAQRLLGSCLLVHVSDGLLRSAARLASPKLRTLDAIHLASALRVESDELLTYDQRMIDAALGHALPVSHPGRS